MKNKLLKFTAVFCALCIAGNIALCVKARKSVVYTGITDMTTTDAALVSNAHIQEAYVYSKNDESYYIQMLEDECENNLELLNSMDTILVVEPTGDMYQYRASLEQQATVVDVVKCPDNLENGDVIRIFRLMGFVYENGIAYCHFENIMYPGNRYLVFLDSSSVNEYTDSCDYIIGNAQMSYFKLDRSEGALTCPSYDFAACRDVLHFTSSAAIAEAISEYEELVIDKFYSLETEG